MVSKNCSGIGLQALPRPALARDRAEDDDRNRRQRGSLFIVSAPAPVDDGIIRSHDEVELLAPRRPIQRLSAG
jgi:hypothetical protein